MEEIVKEYKNVSDITSQVNEVFKYFVKMAEVFNPEYLKQVYETLEKNDSKMFKVLKKAIYDVKEELFNQYS